MKLFGIIEITLLTEKNKVLKDLREQSRLIAIRNHLRRKGVSLKAAVDYVNRVDKGE